MQYDIWAVTPSSDDAYFAASAAIAASGNIALLHNNLGENGTGYKVAIESDGVETGKTFTITGVVVGAVGYDGVVTESLAGPSASVAYSANYYTEIKSISIDAASDGGVKIGYGGDLAFPRTRIKGITYLSGETVGDITFTAVPNNTVLLKVFTPADETAHHVMLPREGILTTKSNSGRGDIAVMTLNNLSKVTVLCG